MVKKLLSTFAILCISGIVAMASDPVPIKFDPDNGREKNEIPVTGTFDEDTGELVLKFGEAMSYDVAVLDASGVVYKERIDGAVRFELRVNVHSRGGEPYTLVITDSDGCVYEGSFVA